MTKFASYLVKPAQEKAALDESAVKVIETFLDNIEAHFVKRYDGERPQLIIELWDEEAEVKTALRRWRLRPLDLAERLNNDGYPMRDIRLVEMGGEPDEVRIWLK